MLTGIYTDKDNTGFVEYDESDQSVMVTHPNDEVRMGVYRYLTNERQFTVPGSNRVGDMRLLIKRPCESAPLMEMALTQMYHAIGVHVDWNHEDNRGSSTQEVTITSARQKQADKPIIKSLEDDGYFQIIN